MGSKNEIILIWQKKYQIWVVRLSEHKAKCTQVWQKIKVE